jgi:hypothetical protein
MPLFPSGQVVVTPHVLRALQATGANVNWGAVSEGEMRIDMLV